nr:F-box/WD repeat-containing protein 1A-like [Anolis sagrei ordinatus]
MDPAEAVVQEKALKFMCSMPQSLWLGCSSLADSMPSLRCLYNPGTGSLTAFQNSSDKEDCNNDEPPRKIIPEKNALRQTYNSCARLCINQEAVCLGSTAMKTENCVAMQSCWPHDLGGVYGRRWLFGLEMEMSTTPQSQT